MIIINNDYNNQWMKWGFSIFRQTHIVAPWVSMEKKNTSAFEDSVQLINSQKNDDVMRFETLLDGCWKIGRFTAPVTVTRWKDASHVPSSCHFQWHESTDQSLKRPLQESTNKRSSMSVKANKIHKQYFPMKKTH